jgi:TrmH family RNA methyltransferase
MAVIREITSRENPVYRYVKSLHDRKTAAKEGVVFLEGQRLCEDALLSGNKPTYLLFNEEKETLAVSWCERFSITGASMIRLPSPLFEKLGSTNQPQGIAIVIPSPMWDKVIPGRGKDIYLVCENTQDPGNLGTMIRTADAFDFTAVLLTGCVDPYNEKVIRASMGSCFHIPILQFETIREACLNLSQMGVELIASHLDGKPLTEAAFRYPLAICIGNEARGLSEECVSLCDRMLMIPMPGKAESLNASVAAAIFAYTAMNQRLV